MGTPKNINECYRILDVIRQADELAATEGSESSVYSVTPASIAASVVTPKKQSTMGVQSILDLINKIDTPENLNAIENVVSPHAPEEDFPSPSVSGCTLISNPNGETSLMVGNLVLLTGNSEKVQLVHKLLHDGYTIDSKQVLDVINAEKSIAEIMAEAKRLYVECKQKNDLEGMLRQRNIYHEAKQKLAK